ncbi:MAG: S9 family peptidase [Deltaproteobacteria bacterium]|nr:S9 family peptidase [Deltaproteobacteria bacterium]
MLVGCAGAQKTRVKSFDYPPAKTTDVADDYHGVKVKDPYRWLEDQNSKETKAWVKAENRLSRKFLDVPGRKKLVEELKGLWTYPKYHLPVKRGGRYFFLMNKGLANQPKLYVRNHGQAEKDARVLVDPNKLSKDGTTAITGFEPSRDGKMLAYLLSSKGSDWQELRILNADNGRNLDEVLKWCKFTGISWKADGSGFFYNRFPNPKDVRPGDRNRFAKVYFHKPGTPQERDILVYERPDDGELGFDPRVTEDGDYLVLTVYRGTDQRTGIYYTKLDENGTGLNASGHWSFTKLFDFGKARYEFLGNKKDVFYVLTDLDAPRSRIVSINLHDNEKKLVELVPQSKDVLHFAVMAGQRILAVYMRDAHHLVKSFDLGGDDSKDIPLPGMGSISGISGRPGDDEAFFSFTSFLRPNSVFRLDVSGNKSELFLGPKPPLDPAGFVTKEVFYKSKDGTRVHMFLVYRKGIKPDGRNPVLLYGYGGFDISITPYFSVYRLPWLEAGGIFAVANLRGGGEYGEEWHKAGMLKNKQNVFDDFISAAEWLIANHYTSRDKLAIMGGSNGGLLTAACLVQRPDLFGAVVSIVPVIDMLRYQKFSVGHFWIPEYGDAEASRSDFDVLIKYSPLHNIKKGVAYPPTLILTADHDDRVVPMHGKKFAAALQAADKGGGPILLFVETAAGHGGGKPVSKRVGEYADILMFLARFLKVTFP